MRARVIEFSLSDLQDALREYMHAKGWGSVEEVRVVSHDKVVLNVETRPQGLVQGVEFKHRSEE